MKITKQNSLKAGGWKKERARERANLINVQQMHVWNIMV
jgi:hypothetical protein